jgi:hypothetical protein
MRLAPASLLLIAACNSTDGPVATDQATITDSAGITIVQNHRPVWGEGEGWKVSAEPMLVIADTLATGEGRWVFRATRLSNGDVVLITDANGRWFDSTGALRQEFALSGGGPGEFEYPPSHLVQMQGESVAVGSVGLRTKVNIYSPDGALVRVMQVERERLNALGRWRECGTHLLPDLSQIGCQRDDSLPSSGLGHEDEGEQLKPGLLRQFARQYRIPPTADTAYMLGVDIGLEQEILQVGGNITSMMHPFHARGAFAGGGTPLLLVNATNLSYGIEVRTPEGRLTHIIRRDNGRRVPTAAERAEADSTLRSGEGYYGTMDPARREQILGALTTPDSLPAHAGLWVARTGEVLSRRWSQWNGDAPGEFDVFDRDGRWLGTLILPPKFILSEVGDDYLVGVQLDADDAHSVVVYGLKR